MDSNAPVARLDEDPSIHLSSYAAWVRQKYEYLPMRGLGGLRLDLRLEDVHVPLELMPRERGKFEMGIHDDAPAALDPSMCTVIDLTRGSSYGLSLADDVREAVTQLTAAELIRSDQHRWPDTLGDSEALCGRISLPQAEYVCRIHSAMLRPY